MKQIFTFIAIAALWVSCSTQPMKSVENLKTAITGESNASAKYAKFAEQAQADSLFMIAKLFEATSKAEAIHAASHVAALAKCGVNDFTPVIEEIVLGTTLENLVSAKAGEDAEVGTMYPEFIAVATEEGANDAVQSFEWSLAAEKTHSAFYSQAIDVVSADSTGSNFTVSLAICPKCGVAFDSKAMGEGCDVCGVPSDKFLLF